MTYKIYDTIMCKKTDYAGLSMFWLIRIFQKEPDAMVRKGEIYYILGLDDDGMPNEVSYYSKSDYEKYNTTFEKEAKKLKNPLLEISRVAWNTNTPKEKKYFSRHFYTDIKDIRKAKLKKLK